MWVVITLASLVVFITAILCIPLELSFRVDTQEKQKFSVKLKWLFGLVTKYVSKKEPKKKKKYIKEKRKRWKISGGWNTLRILKTSGLLRQIKILVRDVFHRLRIRNFALDCRVGLDDPADTGLLYAVVGPIVFFLDSLFKDNIRLRPSFEGEIVFEGYSQGEIRLQPITLVVPVLRFIFSLPAIRVMRRLAWMKWKRKK